MALSQFSAAEKARVKKATLQLFAPYTLLRKGSSMFAFGSETV
jgi:hypothetical protein